MRQRIRGLLGIATVWGVVFAGLAAATYSGFLAAGVLPTFVGLKLIGPVAVRGFVVGAVASTVFATIFGRAERGRNVDTISVKRVGAWGFLGAAALPALIAIPSGFITVVPVATLATATLCFGALGGAISMGMVRLARRAPAHELSAGEP
jgi:hypothetical protein